MTLSSPIVVDDIPTALLVPEAWRPWARQRVHAFNPAITVHQGRRLCAYRLVGADGRRRMAIVPMDADWRPVPDAAIALSDFIVGAPPWHADPRFFTEHNRLWVHFNSGGGAPNTLSIVELCPETLKPVRDAVPLLKRRGRQPVEKNWLLFASEGRVHAIYQLAPHQVLDCVRSEAAWWATPTSETSWDASEATREFGALRGGTPPVRVGELYISFFHGRRRCSSAGRLASLLRGRRRGVWEYTVGAYAFDARGPYTPLAISAAPLITASWRRTLPALNPSAGRVAYPCGAVFEHGTWRISFGENDERCRVATLDHAAVMAGMRPIEATR